MNLEIALTALVTLCRAKMAGCFGRCGHLKACAKMAARLECNNHQLLANSFGISLLLSARSTSPGRGDKDKPPFNGSTGASLRGHPGLA